jgi:hypothetical protein
VRAATAAAADEADEDEDDEDEVEEEEDSGSDRSCRDGRVSDRGGDGSEEELMMIASRGG